VMDQDNIYREKELNKDYEVSPSAFRNLRRKVTLHKKYNC